MRCSNQKAILLRQPLPRRASPFQENESLAILPQLRWDAPPLWERSRKKEVGRMSTYRFALTIGIFALTDFWFQTAQANDVFDVPVNHGQRQIILKPSVHWPNGQGPFSIVVVVNSSAGASDVFLREPHLILNKANIAVAYLDTFSPRGIGMTGQDQTQVSSTEMALDAYRVAEALRRNPRVKPDKIALFGHSKGGITALHAATKAWQTLNAPSMKPFDASVALAPSCELQFREPELVTPLRVFLAEKDDLTLPTPCIRLFERMKSARQSVTYEVVRGAIHSWSTRGYKFDPTLYSARKCANSPLYYSSKGFVSSVDGSLISFRDGIARCESRGALIGGDGDKREYVLKQASAWLKKQGW